MIRTVVAAAAAVVPTGRFREKRNKTHSVVVSRGPNARVLQDRRRGRGDVRGARRRYNGDRGERRVIRYPTTAAAVHFEFNGYGR